MDRLAEGDPEPLGRLMAGVPRRALILGVAQSLRRQTAGANRCFDRLGFRGGATKHPHR
jgi:hypothetical protein